MTKKLNKVISFTHETAALTFFKISSIVFYAWYRVNHIKGSKWRQKKKFTLFELLIPCFISYFLRQHFFLLFLWHINFFNLSTKVKNSAEDPFNSINFSNMVLRKNKLQLGWPDDFWVELFFRLKFENCFLKYKPFVAPPLFTFCLLFIFPQHEGKVIWIYKSTAIFFSSVLPFMTSPSNITVLMITFANSTISKCNSPANYFNSDCYRATAKTEVQSQNSLTHKVYI